MANEESKKPKTTNQTRGRRRSRRKPAAKKVQNSHTETKQNEIKRVPKKEITKKETTKKVIKPVNIEENIEIHVEDIKVCHSCHEHIDKEISHCPNCNKVQKDHTITAIICILASLLIISLVFSYFYNREDDEIEEEFTAELISYEDLMRNSYTLLNTNVKVMGEVLTFDFEEMLITINSNVFPVDETEYIVFVQYDMDENLEFTINDMVIVYGYFYSVEDEIPIIQAKRIMLAD